MPTYDPFHRHGECYNCKGLFCCEHIVDSKKNVFPLSCMLEYCGNQLCSKCQVNKEERCGHVGSYCFACEKHMCNHCHFPDTFVGCQDCGIVLCHENSRLCHGDCDTCEVPYCIDCFKGHAAIICESCDAPTKWQECDKVLDESPQ
jgi:hypothetical protein